MDTFVIHFGFTLSAELLNYTIHTNRLFAVTTLFAAAGQLAGCIDERPIIYI